MIVLLCTTLYRYIGYGHNHTPFIGKCGNQCMIMFRQFMSYVLSTWRHNSAGIHFWENGFETVSIETNCTHDGTGNISVTLQCRLVKRLYIQEFYQSFMQRLLNAQNHRQMDACIAITYAIMECSIPCCNILKHITWSSDIFGMKYPEQNSHMYFEYKYKETSRSISNTNTQ
jgi:hypothetical protein